MQLGRAVAARLGSARAASAHTTHHGTNLVYVLAAIPLLVAVIVALVVWRSARRERTRREFQLRLDNPDPKARRAALDAVTDDVLARNAKVLLGLVESESDPDVLDAIAAAVARSRWEPTQDRDLVELRRWVAGGHARATASSIDRMLRDEATSTVLASSARQAAAEATAGIVAPLGADEVVAPEEPAPAPAPAPPATAATAEPPSGEADVEEHPGLGEDGEVAGVEHEAAEPPAEPQAEPQAEPAPALVGVGAEAPSAAAPDPYDDLVPTVRALLGDDVDRVELRLLNGTVLRAWSKPADATLADASVAVGGPETSG